MATWEEQLIAKGFDRGVKQGVEKGVVKGVEKGAEKAAAALRKALTHLLAARFGQVRPDLHERIAGASASEVDAWIDRAAVADRIDDVAGPATPATA